MKKFYKILKYSALIVILVTGNILAFNLVRFVEGKISLMKPENLTVMEGQAVKQEDYFINSRDVILKNCKNNCLSRIRYTKILLGSKQEYYYLNGNIEEDITGKTVKFYYDKDKKIFPKGKVNSFGLFINGVEKIPVVSKIDRDSKGAYVYLLLVIFADITVIGMGILIKWEESVFGNKKEK